MSEHDRLIEQLATLVGLAPGYRNQSNVNVETPIAARRAVLEGLGLSTATLADTRESLRQIEELRRGPLPAVVVVEAERPSSVAVGSADGANIDWRLTDEAGRVREGRAVIASGKLPLPPLPAGYYRLAVEGALRAEGNVLASPARCWMPRDLEKGARQWGVTAQVYGLHSQNSLGIGDFTDIAEAAAGSGALGASFLGLSPVHALFAADRSKISPYSPSSRLFLESLHIDPRAIEGFAGSDAERLVNTPEFREAAAKASSATLVNHQAAWDLKRQLLELLFKRFREEGGSAAFSAFRRRGGEPLELHATFEALSAHFRTEGRMWLGDWPEEFRSPHSEVVAWFRDEKKADVEFHAWLQWHADAQLAAAAKRARDAGMAIGLYRDLAVGADRGGSEIWAAPEQFSATLSVGAPPDPLGPQGQNWGLPPFNPLALEREGLKAFRALVAANMRHAGAIRIDHAFQLQRLFIIAPGGEASAGSYLDFPFEAMLAVLKVESHRAKCLVIAEDLGTGPENFTDAIIEAGLLSYRVMYFERGEGGRFKPPAEYPRQALSVFTTHDLPTLRGWWRGLDVDLRQTLGVYDRENADRERSSRRDEIGLLCEALVGERLLDDPVPLAEPPLEASVQFLARTASALTALQFEDAAGELNQANLPGFLVGHPNWQRRLSASVAELVAPGGQLAKWASLMAEEGRVTRAAGRLATPPPRATYRLQFHKDFTFDHAATIVPYLQKLGVSHVYASPISQARPGSTHGYDIVDHSRINTELGGEEAFGRFSDTLKKHGLGLILDIVPNHMGVGGADNAAWLSMLEWGELSPLAKAFDVDWERLGAGGKLVVPFLGSRYGEALEKGELKLAFEPQDGSFSVWHWEHRLPICPIDYPDILDRALAALDDTAERERTELLAISERLRAMSGETAPERRAGFPEEAEALKGRIAAVAANAQVRGAIERALTLMNGIAGQPESFSSLHRLLEAQNYRAAHWRVAASDINYRRFFDINALAGIRVEVPEVFSHTHELIFRLVREDRVQGLRIDHIDGLADPEGYARALQAAVGPGFYVVVEKILEPGEELRPWPVAGTTGYDAMNLIDGVFVDTRNGRRFETIYRDISELGDGYGTLLRAAKEEILETSFASELEALVSGLKRIADLDRKTRDYTQIAIRRALVEIVARFPVYRTYIGAQGPERSDISLLQKTVRTAQRWSTLPDRSVHDFVLSTLLGAVDTEGPGRPTPDEVATFRRRFQQLTGPVMAKSLEDTLFYRYVRLISLNEVGGDPDHFGTPVETFHAANMARAEHWPAAMIATATHDMKRGEDSRARLNALSELPDEWAAALDAWRGLVEGNLARVDTGFAPDGNDQSMILQSLLGAWPIDLLENDRAGDIEVYRDRIKAWAEKALREAKRYTSWVNSDPEYETATARLIDSLLVPGGEFFAEFRPLANRLALAGAVTGLARTALKATLPGVPDIYQGTEFWDFSLVDPDNRRPVDYAAREAALDTEADPAALLADWRSGRLKQFVLTRLLADRAVRPALYAEGDYVPLSAQGPKAEHVLAFTRRLGDEALAVIVPRLTAGLRLDNGILPDPAVWAGTTLALPLGRWRDILTGRDIEAAEGANQVHDLLSTFPLAVLRKVT